MELPRGTRARLASSGTWPLTSATGTTTWTAASTNSPGLAALLSTDTTSSSQAGGLATLVSTNTTIFNQAGASNAVHYRYKKF
jgi:hypothetical protein